MPGTCFTRMSWQQRARGRGDKSAHRRLKGDTPERISEVIVRNISNSILFLIGHSQVTLTQKTGTCKWHDGWRLDEFILRPWTDMYTCCGKSSNVASRRDHTCRLSQWYKRYQFWIQLSKHRDTAKRVDASACI